MAPKVPKKPKKLSPEKPIEKLITKPKDKKKKKKNYTSFSTYLFKMLRNLHADKQNPIGITRHSMLIMNNFVNDMIEKIAIEAGRLSVYAKKNTMGSAEVQSAVKLLLPGQLAHHANIEGMKAITLYHKSTTNDANAKKNEKN